MKPDTKVIAVIIAAIIAYLEEEQPVKNIAPSYGPVFESRVLYRMGR